MRLQHINVKKVKGCEYFLNALYDDFNVLNISSIGATPMNIGLHQG